MRVGSAQGRIRHVRHSTASANATIAGVSQSPKLISSLQSRPGTVRDTGASFTARGDGTGSVLAAPASSIRDSVLAASAAKDISARDNSPSPTSASASSAIDGWKTLKIGAGGFISGINIASDGTKVVRTDT
jgi:hypothetical protein